MPKILLLYDTQDEDLARDLRDLVSELGAEVVMIPRSADKGKTLQGKEDAYFANAMGAIFLITPGCMRDDKLYPSPSVADEMGRARERFKLTPDRVMYLVEKGCQIQAVDQRPYVAFDRMNMRSVLAAVTGLIRNLKESGFMRGRIHTAMAPSLSAKAISLLQVIKKHGDQGYQSYDLAAMLGLEPVEVDYLIDQLDDHLEPHPGEPGEVFFTLSAKGRKFLFEELKPKRDELSQREDMEWDEQQGAYFQKSPSGERLGPFCPACLDGQEKKVRMAKEGSDFRCTVCKRLLGAPPGPVLGLADGPSFMDEKF